MSIYKLIEIINEFNHSKKCDQETIQNEATIEIASQSAYKKLFAKGISKKDLSNRSVIVNKNSGTRIYFRTEREISETGKSVHGPSIKIILSSDTRGGMPIIIPTSEFTTTDSTKKFSLAKFMKTDYVNSKTKKFIRSFIYDNQMAIIAYWYSDNTEIEIVILQYILEGNY